MPFSRLLRTSSQPSLADSALADAGGSTSDDSNLPRQGWQASGSKATIRHRPWKADGPSITDHSSPSQSTAVPPSTESKVDTHTPPDTAITSVQLNSVAVPSPERIPAIGAVQDKLAEAWDAVKDGPKIAGTSCALRAVGVSAAPPLFFYHSLIRDSRWCNFYDSNQCCTVHTHLQGIYRSCRKDRRSQGRER